MIENLNEKLQTAYEYGNWTDVIKETDAKLDEELAKAKEDAKWGKITGTLADQTDLKTAGNNDRIRNVTPIPVKPNTTYYKTPNVSNVYFYDANGNFISYSSTTPFFTTPNNCYFICFFTIDTYGTTYNHNIAINYPSTIQAYIPYGTHIVDLANVYVKANAEASPVLVWSAT